MGMRGASKSCFKTPRPLLGALAPADCPPDGTFGETPPLGFEAAETKSINKTRT